MRKRIKFITSFFYLGHSPYMPGTVGSFGGLIVYFLVKDNTALYGFSMLFLLMLGMMFTAEAERIYKRKDPQMIVIDEACGMTLALFLVPYSITAVIIGFLMFRLLDIVKIFPAKQIEKVSGAFGVMFDDIIAALYTNIALQLITRVFCWF